MNKRLNLLTLPTSGLPATETPSSSLANTFALQIKKLTSQGVDADLLKDVNKVLLASPLRPLENLSELGNERIVARLLVYPEIFKEIRRRINLSIPLLDAVLERVERGDSFESMKMRLDSFDITPSQMAPYEGFLDNSYKRNWYSLSHQAEILILCWRPGQVTQPHDHGGHQGIDMVYRGQMLEQRFVPDKEGWLSQVEDLTHRPAESTLIGADLVHQASNPHGSTEDLVSIHMYVHPLWRF